MKIFIDTNILLDLILNRDGADAAEIIMQLNRQQKFEVCASFLTFADIAYILRHRRHEEIVKLIHEYSNSLTVLPMNNAQLQAATASKAIDFEDMLQFQCALEGKCDVVVTSNIKHFVDFCTLPLFNSTDFLLSI